MIERKNEGAERGRGGGGEGNEQMRVYACRSERDTIRRSSKSQNTHTSLRRGILRVQVRAPSLSPPVARTLTNRYFTTLYTYTEKRVSSPSLFVVGARARCSFTSLPLSLFQPLSTISSCVSLSPFITCLYPFVHLRLRVGRPSVRVPVRVRVCAHRYRARVNAYTGKQ